jgi:hypothetical protein
VTSCIKLWLSLRNISDYGIICLTHDNMASVWINFEAGALSKALESARVCPLLFGIKKMEVKGPINQFQMAYPQKDDFYLLLKSINEASGDKKIPENILAGTFSAMWSSIEESFNIIIGELSNNALELKTIEPEIKEQALDEMLEILRSLQRNANEKISTMQIADALYFALNRYASKKDKSERISSQDLWQLLMLKLKPQLKTFLREASITAPCILVDVSAN